MKTLGWIVLFLMFWPVFVIIWWVAPEHRPRFVQQVIDFARAHPKATAWMGLVFGVLLFAGGLGELVSPTRPGNPILGLVFSAGIVLLCGGLLVRWRWQEIQARNREIARRADEQHQAYLAGDDLGLYGTRDMPKL